MKDFKTIYDSRPDKEEHGSSGYSNLKNLYDLCTELKPELIIESGTWKGNSSWLFSHFASMNCYDITFKNLKWRYDHANYYEHDIEQHSTVYIDLKPALSMLFFFDDHISHLQRLKWLIEIGAKHAVFDDNCTADVARTLKNPPSPTLEEMSLETKYNPLLEQIKEYEVMPFHKENKRDFDTRLTYIRL